MMPSFQSVNETYEYMCEKLHEFVPAGELRVKAELVHEINSLKRERGAIILGHNYMEPALFHTVPDVVGDSLELAREAAHTNADPIVFCGVRFMAETAKILNPEKTVLLPAKKAGCSLAESITAEDVRALRERFPGIPIVAYVNTYADVKAEVDVCCTSGNAKKVVESLESDTIIFLPDEFLAKNVARETGKKIIIASRVDGVLQADEANGNVMVGWQGRCEVHEQFTEQDVANIREQFPDVFVLAHPECSPEVIEKVDYSGGTSAMLKEIKQSNAKRFLLLTECSMADNIIAENPEKEMIRLCSVRCPHMAEITLEDTLHALRHNETLIEIPEDIRKAALKSVDRMIQIM